MNVLGLDIGTTSICAVVVDSDNGTVLESRNTANSTWISAESWAKLQDPAKILAISRELVSFLVEKHSPICGIGITGQMHGILYLDHRGEALSPLHIWQDGRGDLEWNNGKSYAAHLSDLAGYSLATGFGAATHFYNRRNGLVPESAAVFCTIGDYIGLKLADKAAPITHVSNAASIGMFDLSANMFSQVAVKKANMDFSLFPRVTTGFELLGEMRGIPVTVSIGDNQASFIGSVADMGSSVLVNVGTGGQISFLTGRSERIGAMEPRPLCGDRFILAGSSLCGGRAYAALESFFRDIACLGGGESNDMYAVMNRLTENYTELENPLDIGTQFCGTREDPSARGHIKNLGLGNFTPRHFAVGVLWGICGELYEKYQVASKSIKTRPSILVGSGNGIRKSAVLQQMFSQRFGMPIRVPAFTEEAALGAAFCALIGTGRCRSIKDVGKMIRYQQETA